MELWVVKVCMLNIIIKRIVHWSDAAFCTVCSGLSVPILRVITVGLVVEWNCSLFIPHHTIVAGYYGITLAVRVSLCCTSVRPYFRAITWVSVNGFSPNSVDALILRRSGFGLLMGLFRQFLTELSAPNTSVFSFLDDNFIKYQWIVTKLGVCIDIVETWFGQISSIFGRVICPWHIRIFFSGW